jgi:hypothetical protein
VNNTQGSYACFDVTDLVRYYYSQGFQNASFEINSSTGPCPSPNYILMSSKEYAGHQEYLDLTIIDNYSESYLTGNAISYNICNGSVLEKHMFVNIDGVYTNITIPYYCDNGCSGNSCNWNPLYNYLMILIIICMAITILWWLFK